MNIVLKGVWRVVLVLNYSSLDNMLENKFGLNDH